MEKHTVIKLMWQTAQVYALAEKVKDNVGKVTILVNNTEILNGKHILDCPDEKI